MDAKVKQKVSTEKAPGPKVKNETVDFELWASAVRQQMIDCLQKRAERSRSEF